MQALVVLGFLASSGVGEEVKIGVVPKVIQLLQGMAEKGKKEKHEEQVQFAAYKQFCDDTSTGTQNTIKAANLKIEKLTADIQQHEASIAAATQKIAEEAESKASNEKDEAAATETRKTEHADYQSTHADYSESVDALQRAIAVVKKQAYDRAQAGAFLQVKSLVSQVKRVPQAFQPALTAFLQQAPEADGYEFQSSGVVDMLEKLEEKFVDEKTALEKEEMNAKSAYDLLKQDLSAQIAASDGVIADKTEERAKDQQANAEKKGTLADTTATRDADQAYLQDLVATCSQKSSDFEARQTLRAEELEAIAKAVEIMSSDQVSGSATKHLPGDSFLQTALTQLRAEQKQAAPERVAGYLQKRAQELNSRILATVATHAASDPFSKVKKMIQDLVTRLSEEANNEVEHKGWCDTELTSNEQTRKEKTEAVEGLTSNIDQLKASIATLGSDLAELTAAISNLDKAAAEATKLRSDEKSKNEETVKDATGAQTAVAQALQVLQEFYNKAGSATSLVQVKASQQPEAPAIFDASYKGMQSENGGIIGMLEVIQSDFARLEADTTAAEATAVKEYDNFMQDTAVDKAQKSKDVEHKTASKQEKEQALTEKEADLAGTQKELDAAVAYFDKLKPSCVDAGTSYEERVARREEEIESLKEALKILNGEDI